MNTPRDAQGMIREQLSALMDGELAADQVERLTRAWHGDPDLQAQWHAYHWVRDALHFQELTSTATHDAKFLQSLRSRLAHEPVSLTPGLPSGQALAQVSRYRVTQPLIACAAVLMVGAVVWALRPPGGATGPAPVVSEIQAPVVPPVFSGVSRAEPDDHRLQVPMPSKNGVVIFSDGELNHYLHAHQEFGGSSALVSPAGFVRHVGTQAFQ